MCVRDVIGADEGFRVSDGERSRDEMGDVRAARKVMVCHKCNSESRSQ
jgi:hypothetical protein